MRAVTRDYRDTKDVPVIWRGSVTDLVTDLEPLLGPEGLGELERVLRERRRPAPEPSTWESLRELKERTRTPGFFP